MAMAVTKKRPAAAPEQPEPTKKKPASWQQFATGAPEGDAEADQKTEKDTSSLTKQQRYLFDRALASGALPDEVQEVHQNIKKERQPGYPKQLNAVVNAIIPKDAGYGSQINFQDPATLQKFESTFRSQSIARQQDSRLKQQTLT